MLDAFQALPARRRHLARVERRGDRARSFCTIHRPKDTRAIAASLNAPQGDAAARQSLERIEHQTATLPEAAVSY